MESIRIVKEWSAIYFFIIFILILIRTYCSSNKEKLENYKYIPFKDDKDTKKGFS